MRHRRSLLACTLALGLATTACHRPREADPRMVSEWMHHLYGAVRAERLSPPVASRLFAYATTGLYAGLAAATPSLPRIEGRVNGLSELPRAVEGERYDPTITAVVAERVILDSLFREGLATTRVSLARLADSLIDARVEAGIADADRARSEELGRRTGLAIVAWSQRDGFDSTRGRKYVPPAGPGLWLNDAPPPIFTPQNISGATMLINPANPGNTMIPGNVSDRGLILDRQKRGNRTLPAANMAGITEPYWGHVRPFSMKSWDECPIPAPAAYSETSGQLYDEARHVLDVSRALTPEQRTTVLYWADNGGETGTPAGHWLSIGSQMISEKQLRADEAAWMMAQTGLSLADAFISSWGYKFKLNTVRPRPYIRATIDSTWEPAIPTPPFPEYVSGHSTVSAAAAATLTAVLGDVAFVDSTAISIGHAPRSYPSFRAAADEAGLSRIFGGIHFPSGNVEGANLGRCVASKVLARFNGGKLP